MGCTDPAADNYDATATIEGSCEYLGCTSFAACNYDPNANVNDGSCEFLSCVGCLNEAACNYDETATQSGSCVYPIPGFNCDGTCIDTDMDGVCDADEVLGCTDETALNYDADATEDGGNCVLPVLGCTDPTACNYDALANTNDGSCDFESCYGCLNVNACNYDAEALYPDAAACVFADANACESCEGGAVVLNDADGDGVSDCDEVSGCTDQDACNFDANASSDNGGICIYAEEGYDCDGNCLGPNCCGGGTYWDLEAQVCVPTLSADLDLNGCVGAPDLLELLAQFGECSDIEPEWQCGDAVEYQGHAYATVLIDDQCWFAENLQNAYLNTGGELFEIDNEEDWLFNFDNNYAGYCYPLFFDGFGPNFGKLYNIHAILSPHLCPVDWHVSTDADWFSLETHLGMPVEALTTSDRELYEIGHDLKDDELWNGTNDTGFSVVPAGEKSGHNGFAPQGYSASFLTTTQPGGFSSYVGRSFGEGGTVGRGYYFERGGYSVRCVKD